MRDFTLDDVPSQNPLQEADQKDHEYDGIRQSFEPETNDIGIQLFKEAVFNILKGLGNLKKVIFEKDPNLILERAKTSDLSDEGSKARS